MKTSKRISGGMFHFFVLISLVYAFGNENSGRGQSKHAQFGTASVQGYWPISNRSSNNADVITSPFGPRYLQKAPTPNDYYDFHEGIDISANYVAVYAAFDGTIEAVKSLSNDPSDDRFERWVKLRHVDPEDPDNPNDDTVFYTCYDHLDWTSQLQDLEDLVGNTSAQIVAGSSGQTYTDPGTGKFYEINPFAQREGSATRFHVHLPEAGQISAVIYNVLGEEVQRVYSGAMPGGRHALRWEGKNALGQNVGAGLYLIRVEFVGSTGRREVVMRRVAVVR